MRAETVPGSDDGKGQYWEDMSVGEKHNYSRKFTQLPTDTRKKISQKFWFI